MKQFLLSVLLPGWCLLAAPCVPLHAQVKGCWVLQDEFIDVESVSSVNIFTGEKHFLEWRSHRPGSATLVVRSLVAVPEGDSAPEALTDLGEYRKAGRKAALEAVAAARNGTSGNRQRNWRSFEDELEFTWKMHAPQILYYGDETSAFAEYAVELNGKPLPALAVAVRKTLTLKVSPSISFFYCADGAKPEDSEDYLPVDVVLDLLRKARDGSVSVVEVMDEWELDGDGEEESSDKPSGKISIPKDDWKTDGEPNPHSSFLLVAFGAEVHATKENLLTGLSGGEPVSSTRFAHLCFYKFSNSGNIAVTQAAPETHGEDKGTDFPWWIVGAPAGAIAAGGAIRRITKKKRSGRKDRRKQEKDEEKEEPEEEKKPSIFKMILYKEFGNTLKVGEKTERVGVRIEEITFDGRRIRRPDLTRRVEARQGEHIKITGTGYAGEYYCADIVADAPEDIKQCEGTLTFIFFGEGGQMHNNLIFKIVNETQQIIFQQDNITFIAGRKMECNMAFRVLGVGDDPDLVLKAEIVDSKSSEFELSEVRPDEAGMWCFDICDRKENANQPGNMYEYTCRVTAKKFDRKTGREKTIEGSFLLFRFHEGIRMYVEHLKAYPVVKGSESTDVPDIPPKTYKEQLAAPRSKMLLTLFVYNEKENRLESPPIREATINIEDVADSVQFFGKNGEEIPEPCRVLGFQVEAIRFSGEVNTLSCEIFPSAFLMPPTRAKGKISVRIEYGGRTFAAEQTVMVFSMPFRSGTLEQLSAWRKEDEKIENHIMHMRASLLNRPSAPQMRPLIHKLGLLLDSYSPDFGYCMQEYAYLSHMYMRFVSGEIGPFYVNENVYNLQEVIWNDAYDMTIADSRAVFPDSFVTRLSLGLLTFGASEVIVYTPRDFLMMCDDMANMQLATGYNCTFWENFSIGGLYGAREYLMACAFQELIKAGAASRIGKGLKQDFELFTKKASELTKQLGSRYSAFGKAMRIGKAMQRVGSMRIDAKGFAKKALAMGRQRLNSSPELQHLAGLAKEAKAIGKVKVDRFVAACKNPNATSKELVDLMLDIQHDRYAKTIMNSSQVSDKFRWRFQTENHILIEHTKKEFKEVAARAFNVNPSEVTFFNATGNTSKSAVSCRKIGMDYDYTPRIRGIDMPEDQASMLWNDIYYKNAKGKLAATMAEADEFAHLLEHTAVNKSGAESFGSDVEIILDKTKGDVKYQDAQRVADTQIHKIKEPLHEARELAREAMLTTDLKKAAQLRQRAIACYQEAARQMPKGASRTLSPKLEAALARGNEMKINMSAVQDAQNTCAIIEDALARDSAGDSDAVIEMMAYFESEGSSLDQKAEQAFSLIPLLNELI